MAMCSVYFKSIQLLDLSNPVAIIHLWDVEKLEIQSMALQMKNPQQLSDAIMPTRSSFQHSVITLGVGNLETWSVDLAIFNLLVA